MNESNFDILNAIPLVEVMRGWGYVAKRDGDTSASYLCPWHDDHRPDLAFYGERCYCHACHQGGDAVALTARLHGLTMAEAARKINADFRLGLDLDAPAKPAGPTEAQRRRAGSFGLTRALFPACARTRS